MTRQVLGRKKHAKCEAVGGRRYKICLTRGGWPHHHAECIHEKDGGGIEKDWIDYAQGVLIEREQRPTYF